MTDQSRAGALDGRFARRWLAQFVTDVGDHVALLTDLDRQAGDGDFGVNLTSALAKAQGFLDRLAPESFADVFDAVSKGFLNTGGTSGPLFGMWFREIGKAARTPPLGPQALAAGVGAGLAVIQRLGKASVGDKTMVDAMAPAAAALARASGRDDDLGSSLLAAAEAAQVGAESTRALIASRGRASYVGEVARGILDPGAVTVALFFRAGVVAALGDGERGSSWLTG
jgi:dihydroxyacetone kinase-like protein